MVIMSCTNPLYALDLGINPETGKRKIKILPKRVDCSSLSQLEYKYGKGNIFPLPCGKCLSCKQSKAREWAVRCTLEASLYEDNCFLTLTYDDAHLPSTMAEVKKHLQNFIRSLRDKGFSVRYFGCGEKGTKTERKHGHLILFGFYPPDVKKNQSALLNECWPYGYVFIGDCTFESCQYVARYAIKKIFKDDLDEFLMMSLKPGIGAAWVIKHWEIFENDAVYGSFKRASIPRYFEKLAEYAAYDLTDLKAKRISKSADFNLYDMLIHRMSHIENLYKYKSDISLDNYEKQAKRRDL